MRTHQYLNEMENIDAFELRLSLERGIRITIALDAESSLHPLITTSSTFSNFFHLETKTKSLPLYLVPFYQNQHKTLNPQ